MPRVPTVKPDPAVQGLRKQPPESRRPEIASAKAPRKTPRKRAAA